MTFKEFVNRLKEYWFQILIWVFIAGMLFLAYTYGTRHRDTEMDVAETTCESVGKRPSWEKYRSGNPLVTSRRFVCL